MKRETKRIAELRRIAARHGGILRAEDVVTAARPKTSALHSAFDWDNTRAAHLWRLEQARHIIRVSVQYITSGKTPMAHRVFVSLSTDRGTHVGGMSGGGYRNMVDVLTVKQHREQMLEDALEDMLLFRQKYAHLSELVSVVAAMKKVERRLKKK